MARNIRQFYSFGMRGVHQTLTEKEKQTLRLLVSGYDAKSMAKHLGLSVHTINERLRDARRKLGTSSSREAARILHEIEATTPELFADKALGDAPGMGNRPPSGHQPDPGGLLGRNGWMIGGFAMSLPLALLALASLSGGTQTAAPSKLEAEQATTADQTAVVDAARKWLALVDARDWTGSWNGTSSAFKAQNSEATWAGAAGKVHGQFGPAQSRELVSAEEVPAPPNGYWLVKFKASYANKPQGIETLALAREDGVWKVVGIYVD